MKIALVNTLYAPFGIGGAGRSVKELAEALVRRGNEVQVNTLAPGDFPTPREKVNGVDVRRFRSDESFGPFNRFTPDLAGVRKLAWHAQESWRPAAGGFLRDAFDEFEPDVVHTNNIAGFGLAAWDAAGKRPLVHTMRDFYLVCARSQLYRNGDTCDSRCVSCVALKTPVKLARRTPDIFVGISQDIIDHHRNIGVIRTRDTSRVVHNWPELSREPAPKTPGPARTFGLLGRLGEDKGTWVAIKAFQALPRELRETTRLLIAGSASEGDQKRLNEAMRTTPQISYLGRDVNAVDFFEQVDVALVPSQWFEPFGRVAAEAALAGVYVIASKTGGLPEVAEQFGGGELVSDFGAPEAWTREMESAIRAEMLPAPVAGQGAARIETQYADVYSEARRMRAARR
jgi:glycosyltransferase involved in cell wall biosynthesis